MVEDTVVLASVRVAGGVGDAAIANSIDVAAGTSVVNNNNTEKISMANLSESPRHLASHYVPNTWTIHYKSMESQ